MEQIFVKKYWEEEDILFYLHFRDGDAFRQIEISPAVRFFLDTENTITWESMLYDQKLEELDLDKNDFISKHEFDAVWEEQHSR